MDKNVTRERSNPWWPDEPCQGEDVITTDKPCNGKDVMEEESPRISNSHGDDDNVPIAALRAKKPIRKSVAKPIRKSVAKPIRKKVAKPGWVYEPVVSNASPYWDTLAVQPARKEVNTSDAEVNDVPLVAFVTPASSNVVAVEPLRKEVNESDVEDDDVPLVSLLTPASSNVVAVEPARKEVNGSDAEDDDVPLVSLMTAASSDVVAVQPQDVVLPLGEACIGFGW